jgi:hypothetical protein
LWERLISDLLDDDESITLIGIGTLLNDVIKRMFEKVRGVKIYAKRLTMMRIMAR